MGRGRTPGSPSGPGTPRTPGDPRRGRRAPGQQVAAEPARQRGDLSFNRRFWTWTLAGALAAGLLMLSVSWDQEVRPASESLAWAAVGFGGVLIGAIGARVLRRRLSRP